MPFPTKFRSIPISIQLDEKAQVSPQTIPADVQIMRTGTFNFGAQGNLKITSDMLKSMVLNFGEKIRGVDLAIDYKHDSEDVAAGWIKDLYLKNGDKELWANVDWTPNGRKVLSDKEFRYLSADFHLNFEHNETNKSHGPTLFGAGLTNRPFIKDMEPVVTLSETPKGQKQMDPKDQEIAALKEQLAALQGSFKLSEDAQKEKEKEQEELKKTNEELTKKVEENEAEKVKQEEEKKLSEKKAAFDSLMVAGKAVEAQREAFMAGDTLKFAEKFVAPNLQGKGNSEEPTAEATDSPSAQAQIVKLAEKILKDNRAKTIGEAQKMALSENPELSKKIYG